MTQRLSILALIFFLVSNTGISQEYLPQKSLPKVLEVYDQGVSLNSFVEREKEKFERLDDILKGHLKDTIFNLPQTRLYNYLKGFVATQPNRPLSEISASALSEYSVAYMRDLEAQRQTADALYDHVKHQITVWLGAESNPVKARILLEGLELLGRSTVRAIVELNESDVDALVNHMDDRKVEKILLALSKLQRKAVEVDFTKIVAFNNPIWVEAAPQNLSGELKSAYQVLMRPIDKDRLQQHHDQLKALVQFQTAYTKLVGSTFSWYLQNALVLGEELTISAEKPIQRLKLRWLTIQNVYKSRFNENTNVSPDEALSWLQADLKEDYFEFRLLLRDLKVIEDIPGEITVLSKRKVERVMDSVAVAWNNALETSQISLDTTRKSLTGLIELGLPRQTKSLLAEQLMKVDTIYRSEIFKHMSWTSSDLDSLILTTNQKQQLITLTERTLMYFDQLSQVITDPGLVTDQLGEKYTFQSEWNENGQVRYRLQERVKVEQAEGAIVRIVPTGVRTPWVDVPDQLWEKGLVEFKAEWDAIIEQLDLVVNKEVQMWLASHGFPGVITTDFAAVEVKGGIPFLWLGKWWKLVFNNSTVDSDTIRFTFDDLDNPNFWESKIENIAKENLQQELEKLQDEVITYWKPVLKDVNLKIPDSLAGYLRGDTIIYSYDLGQAIESLSGATATFKYNNGSWTTTYQMSNSVLIGRLSELYPAVDFRNVSYDSQTQQTQAELWVKLGINDPFNVGRFLINQRGELSVLQINNSNTEIKLGNNLELKLLGLQYSDNTFTWSNVIFQDLPFHIEELRTLNAEFALSLSIWPSLSIVLNFKDGYEKKFTQIITNSLNARGLLPAGVEVSEIEVTENGIYPKFRINEGIKEEIKEQVQIVSDSLSQIPIALAKDPTLIQLGAKVEQLEVMAKSWELDEKVEVLKLLRDALQNPTPSNINRLMQELNDDEQIVLANGVIIEIKERSNEIKELDLFVGGFDCGARSFLTVEVEEDKFIPEMGSCLETYIEEIFNKDIVDNDLWKLRFEASNMRFVLSGITEIPLEMYVGLDGNISWNYSSREVAEALTKPIVDEAERQAKEQFQKINIEVTANLSEIANDLLEQWETLFATIGLQIENKQVLRQQLASTQSPSELFNKNLSAKLKATTGLLTGVTIEGVTLKVENGLAPDFSKARANLQQLTAEINSWAPTYLTVNGDLILSNGVVNGQLMLQIPDFHEIPVPLKVDMKKGTVETKNWKEIILEEVRHVINKKLLPYKLINEHVSLQVVRAEGIYPKLHLKSIMTIASGTDFDIPLPVNVILDFENESINIIPEEDIKALFAGVANQVLKVVSLPLLEDNSWIKDVSLYPPGDIPQGLLVVGEAPLWGVAKITIPGLIISHQGVDFADDSGVGITFGGVEVLVPPFFKLIEPAGEINGSELTFTAKLTFSTPPAPIPQAERVIYSKGSFTVDLEEPLVWQTRTDVVALQVFNLGYSRQKIDLDKGVYEMQIDFGGPLKDIIAIEGQGRAEVKGPKITASGDMKVFGESVAAGTLVLNLSNQTIVATSNIDIPVTGSIGSHFSTERHFSNPTVAASKSLKIWKFTLADTRFLISPNVASSQFSVIGISMGLQVPGYKKLTKEEFEKLLKNLLSPDFDHLDEALLALLSGDITLSPFSGFGPGGGGIGGDDGDGGSGGSGGKDGSSDDAGYDGATAAESRNSTTTGKSTSPGAVQTNVSTTPIDLPSPEVATVGDGKSAALIAGKYSFPVKKEGQHYRAYKNNSEDPDMNVPMSFVFNLDSIPGHFVKSGSTYHSAGFLLNVTKSFYAHILKQELPGNTCGSDHGAIHWYRGEGAESVNHLQMPLSQLQGALGSLCYSQLDDRINSDQALGYWLRAFSLVVGNNGHRLNSKRLIADTPGSIFKLDAQQGVYAVAIRFFNNLDHTLIIASKKGSRVIEVPEINLIKDNPAAQKSLLNIIDKHATTSIGLFEKAGSLYLYTGCDSNLKKRLTYKLAATGFELVVEKSEACEPIVPPPSPDPKPVTPPTPIDSELIGPGNCAVELQESNGNVSFHCSPNPSAFAYAPVQFENYVLFKQNGGNWEPNSPGILIWKLGTGLTRYVVNASTENQAILWVNGRDPYTISKLPLGTNRVPSWSRLKPEAFQQNQALHGAFAELTKVVERMAYNGHILKHSTIEYFEDDDIVAFVVQFAGRPSSEYWACICNSASQRQLTRTFSSGAGSPSQLPNFENHLNELTQ